MTAYQAALKYMALARLFPRKAPCFARQFEATATEAGFDEYLFYVWGDYRAAR
jgi:hypothetical protein